MINTVYQPKPTNDKIIEMQDYISGYWQKNDIWRLESPLFNDYRRFYRVFFPN